MNERIAGTLHEQAEALSEFSNLTYGGALGALRAKPELVETTTRMISERGIHQLERLLEERREDPTRVSSGRRITRLSSPGHPLPHPFPSSGASSRILLRIAGFSAFLAFCVFVWLGAISIATMDIKHGVFEGTLAVAFGLAGFACFSDWQAHETS